MNPSHLRRSHLGPLCLFLGLLGPAVADAADAPSPGSSTPFAAAMRAVSLEPVDDALSRLQASGADEAAYLAVARTYRESLAPSRAAEVLDAAVEHFATVGVLRAAVTHHLGFGETARARELADLLLELHPEDAAALESVAAVSAADGHAEEAAELLRRSSSLGGDPLAWISDPLFADHRLSPPLRDLMNPGELASELVTLDVEAQLDRLALLREIVTPEAAGPVVDLVMTTDDARVRSRGLAAIAALGDRAVDSFAALLARGDAIVRLAALRTLRAIAGPTFMPLLEGQLADQTSLLAADLAEVTLAEIRARDASLEDAERILGGINPANQFRHLAVASLAELERHAGFTAEADALTAEASAVRAEATKDLDRATVLERYAECQNRLDIQEVRALLEQHRYVAPVDARVYGLPENDFDDQKAISLADRLMLRQLAAELGEGWPEKGPIQYPREILHGLRQMKRDSGTWVECSELLEGLGEDVESLVLDWETKVSTSAADDNETNIVVNPRDERYLVGTANDTGSNGNDVYRSSDRGATWVQDTATAARGACDPVSYYNRIDGTDYLYHTFLEFNASYSNVNVRAAYSTDNGDTWSACTDPEPNYGYDRQDLAIDDVAGSPCQNTLYVGYHAGTQYMRASTGTSAPYCQSWTSRLSAGQSGTIGSAMVVNTNGRAHNLFSKYSSPAGVYDISTADCGASWGTASRIATYTYANFDWGIPSTCSRTVYHYTQADSDRQASSPFRNRIYVTWNDLSSNCTPPGCTGNTTCNTDVYVAVGVPNNAANPTGWSWTTYNLTDALTDDYTDEFYPSLTVDQADGAVYLSYYRTNSGASGIAPRRDEVHYVVLRSVTGADSAAEWELLQVTAQPSCETSACGGNTAMQWGDYTWNDVVNGVAYPIWTDRRDDADEDNWVGRVCTEPAHWSERGNSPTAPATTVTDNGNDTASISWTAPDITSFAGTDTVWGDGGDNTAGRRYQLLVDGSAHPSYSNIPPATTSIASFTPADCASHAYRIRAVNGCGVSKDYAASSWSSGVATPGAPTADDVDACALDGIEITWTGVSGATSYDLLVDGSILIPSVTSPYTYTPGNNVGHTFQVRASSTSCTGAWSGSATGVDADGTPAPPGAPVVDDLDACQRTGLEVSWPPVVGATAYDLRVDLATIVPGVSSPYTSTPGDGSNHSYEVRARSASCTGAWTAGAVGVDGDDTAGAVAAPRVVDVTGCAQTGVTVRWLPVANGDRYDLRVDGVTVLSDVTSPMSHDPGDMNPHGYEIRASSVTCGDAAWSQPTIATDGTPLDQILLCDGFETGTTGGWTTTVP